jgi:hypothetical protein
MRILSGSSLREYCVRFLMTVLTYLSYWVPNVSGGLVISKIAQRTKWDLDSNIEYARTAERVGFEYALSQIRFMAGYGAVSQEDTLFNLNLTRIQGQST